MGKFIFEGRTGIATPPGGAKHLDDYFTIAKELGYSDEVLKKLLSTTDENEKIRIMTTARRNKGK